MEEKKDIKIYKICIKLSSISLGILAAVFAITLITRKIQFSKITAPEQISLEQTMELQQKIYAQYPENYKILKSLPYNLVKPELNIGAESAILINVSNGNVLYEKNADEVIPPASMTKLFSMFVVEQEVSAGNLSYDQIIPLPKESWACNMPPHSSLMFLGEDQIVTLKELLLGLSICSGNDAAYALAYTICGNMEDFVDRMNQISFDLGLENTHFVESSGYSELNTTTAREMVSFCRTYLTNHPQSLKEYHGVKSFTYPQAHNLAPGDVLQTQDFSTGLPRHITMAITQKNTNPLLGKLLGCDGLKTGYIDESGYNLALTAERNGTRFLSVTMKGKGNNTAEGQKGRIQDGTELMEWAFSSFFDYSIEDYLNSVFVKTYAAQKKGIYLVPAFQENTVSVPLIKGNSREEILAHLRVETDIPDYLFGEIESGKQYGSIKIMIDNFVLQEIPLVSDRNLKKSNLFIKFTDTILL